MDSTNQVAGVTGAVYKPLNTTPQAVDIRQAMSLIQEGISQLTTLIISLSAQVGENPPQNQDLHETVSLVLQQADWFEPMLEKNLDNLENIVENAVRDRIDDAVSSWFSNEFELCDYVSIDELIKEVLETKLSRATITVDL